MNAIGKITRVDLRSVWKHEAISFTRWLTENPDVLSDVIGVPLLNVERERAAGSFIVDMHAEDENGGIVVIENQLEKSDHDHLGKLITYVSQFDAKIAVWIVASPRPEHTGAINWLNQLGSTLFFLLKLEAVKIGESEPAPLLTLITGPSEEAREVGKIKKEAAERYSEREAFWGALLKRAKGKTQLFTTISPGPHSYIQTGAGRAGINYLFRVRQDDAAVELYIDRPIAGESKDIFDRLLMHREAIEADFGAPLEWDHVEGRRACVVKFTISDGGYRSPEDDWPTVQDTMIEAMIRLEKALRARLSSVALAA